MCDLISDLKALKENSVKFFLSRIWLLDAPKRMQKFSLKRLLDEGIQKIQYMYNYSFFINFIYQTCYNLNTFIHFFVNFEKTFDHTAFLPFLSKLKLQFSVCSMFVPVLFLFLRVLLQHLLFSAPGHHFDVVHKATIT